MPTLADRGMGLGLKALNQLAGSPVVDRLGLREPVERAVYTVTKNGFRGASAASRAFTATQKLRAPARPAKAKGTGLFDLTPTDEQQMLVEAVRAFADAELRPAALKADDACGAPRELLDGANELGLAMLGVPEELGGAVSERSAVTSVLVAEAMAHGDLGLALAILANNGVSTALGLWGDAEQQAKYLPSFAGDEPPAAAVAIQEPRPLFDPFALHTKATADGEGYRIDGVKSLVPRGADAELLLVAADDGGGPALFVVESGGGGVAVEPEPAMGLRPAGTSTVTFTAAPATKLCDGADYAEAVQRARLGWCALSVGCAQAVLDYLIPYVNERVAFGEPISHRQAVAFNVADLAIEIDGMRLATYRAASLADQGKDFAHATALAHRLCADHGMRIGSDGVQLLGGHGFVKEHPVERWYRDLRATGVMEGALLV